MGPRHRQLFESYVDELTKVQTQAHVSFADAVRREQLSSRVSSEEAEAAVRARSGPPAAHPRVLGTITKYFFASKALNEELERQGVDDFVYPQVFVHEMLTGKHQDLWEFLADLDYLPIGLTPDDEWV